MQGVYPVLDKGYYRGTRNLTCRFLADLMNPRGKHGQGVSFLRPFLDDVLGMQVNSEEELNHAVVATGSALCHGLIALLAKRFRLFLPHNGIGAIVNMYILCHIVGVSCIGLIVSDGGNAYGEKQKRTGT